MARESRRSFFFENNDNKDFEKLRQRRNVDCEDVMPKCTSYCDCSGCSHEHKMLDCTSRCYCYGYGSKASVIDTPWLLTLVVVLINLI